MLSAPSHVPFFLNARRKSIKSSVGPVALFIIVLSFHAQICAAMNDVSATVASPEANHLFHAPYRTSVPFPIPSFVRQTNVEGDSSPEMSTSEADDATRITTVGDGDVVVLESKELRLVEELLIDAWNVEIRGVTGGTSVYCPPSGHAVVVRCTQLSCARNVATVFVCVGAPT